MQINWRAGFFRAWVLVSIIWAIGWSIVVLPNAGGKITAAQMTEAELMAPLGECKLPPDVPPPPKGFHLDDCLKALKKQGRTVDHWRGGDDYAEQAFRIVRAFIPELVFFGYSTSLPFIVRSLYSVGLSRLHKDTTLRMTGLLTFASIAFGFASGALGA